MILFGQVAFIAASNPPGPQMKLFQGQPGVTGFIILFIFIFGLVAWFGFSFLSYLRKKRQEQLPAIQGNPQNLLDQVSSVVSLGSSDRYLLSKVAGQLKLPQPASILLSPILLVEAAKAWEKSHGFSLTRNWGLNRLDSIALQVFGKPLRELGFDH